MEISCVIPAFERLDLLTRCLTSVTAQEGVTLDIVVSDDSLGGDIGVHVATLAVAHPNIRYLRGSRTGNAVDNWNHGLDRARGDLLLLVHQDEFLVDARYLARAVAAMKDPAVAAVLGPTVVTGVTRRSKFALAAAVARRLGRPTWLLPAVNWIGPTAAFTFRRGHRFDRTLAELTDVEFYGRVLKTGRLAILTGTCVGSLGYHPGQITAAFDTRAAAIAELDALAARTPAPISPAAHALCRAALVLRAWVG